jgi:uncharacterized protein (TIGR02099 family)
MSRTLLRWGVGLVLGAWTLVLIAWLTLHWGILPHIDRWRAPIEQQVSAALGVPVRIGQIEVRSGGWVPAVELREVTLHDAQDRVALRLPRVVAAVSARSLLALQPRFEQLLLDAPDLEVRRDPLGRMTVAGLELGGGGGGDAGEAADWFFAQHEFVIRGGAVRWVDELRLAQPLALTDVQLVVRNGLRRHEWRVDATPPEGWGTRFSVRGQFTQSLLARRGDWRRWSGTLHADLPHVDMRELRAHVDLPFDLSGGQGALRAWLDVERGRPGAATLDLALRAVDLRLGRGLAPLAFESLGARVQFERDDDGVRLAARELAFVTGDGRSWPAGDLDVAWRQRDDGTGGFSQPVTGGNLRASRLDLATMAGIAERLPLGEPVRALLADVAPQGIAENLVVQWGGPPDAPTRYAASGRLSGLSLAAQDSPVPGGLGRPGVHNAAIEFDASERGGRARLAVNGGSVEFPGVFEQPRIAMDRLDGELTWRIDARADGAAPRIELATRELRFANADAQGQLAATWHTGAGGGVARGGRFPGVLEMSGRLDRGAAARTARYLPLGLPESARRYVQRAVRSGQIESASFKVKGDLWDFPFYTAQQGEFRIAASVQGVALDVVPSEPASDTGAGWTSPWPGFTQVSGELVFDRTSMQLRNARGRVYGFEFDGVQGRIADFAREPTLEIEGLGQGPLADALRYVQATPVGHWIGDALAQGSASGASQLRLALRIPLGHAANTGVRGSLTLPGNDVRIRPDTLPLAAARARVDFSEGGFAVVGASARVLGGEARFEGGSRPDGSLRFTGQGTASAEGLRQAAQLGWLSQAAGAFSGQASYRVELGVVDGRQEIDVSSNLVGLASTLPAPLGKAAEATLPLRYASRLQPAPGDGGGAGAPRPPQAVRDELRLDIGEVLQAHYQRDVSGDEPRVLSGSLGLGAPAPAAGSGVQAVANVARVDTDAWRAALRRLGLLGAGTGTAAATDAASPYAPTRIALRAGELVGGSRRLTRAALDVSRAGAGWRASVDADQLAGHLEWQPAAKDAPARVMARLARLALPPAEVAQVEDLLDDADTAMPALDIVIDDFELRGKRLGRVEIEAQSRVAAASGAPAQWRLSRLALTVPEAQLSASGQWTPSGAAQRSVLDFRLDVSDSGALLERLGTPRAIRGGKGKLQGQVSWMGSPLSFDLASLGGDMRLDVDAGQFLKADGGAAKLLGVLNLQALPRRLALDFRDVFQEGFAFDSIEGNVRIERGVASTNNLRMRGVQAAVLMEGDADLQRETQDLRVIVVPEVNAGTASLAYAVINPALGVGTFLAQIFLRRPLMEAATREFHVSGAWADPKVQRVERTAASPAPDIDRASAGDAPPAGTNPSGRAPQAGAQAAPN